MNDAQAVQVGEKQGIFIVLAVVLLVTPLLILVGSVTYSLMNAHPHEKLHTKKKAGLAVATVTADLYASCVMCHGAQGEGMKTLGGPRLAGQSVWYLKSQLQKFKSGVRGAHPDDAEGRLMAPMANLLADDAAIDAVVGIIAKFPNTGVVDRIEGDLANGKAKFATCAACHGAGAEGKKEVEGPSLQGQHAWYLKRQITKFKKGVRGGDAAKDPLAFAMAGMVKAMLPTDKDVTDVVAYIQSLEASK